MATFTPVLTFLLALNAASALKCYRCNSKDMAACAWDWGASFIYDVEECASGELLFPNTDQQNLVLNSVKCYKMIAETEEGKKYVTRGCLPPSTGGCNSIVKAMAFAYSHDPYPYSMQNLTCNSCDTDKCNSA